LTYQTMAMYGNTCKAREKKVPATSDIASLCLATNQTTPSTYVQMLGIVSGDNTLFGIIILCWVSKMNVA